MKTYLELKDQVADPPHPNPTYPERPDTPSPQNVQASMNRMTKQSRKRSRNHQANRRQYKVRLVEIPLVLSRALATLIPTTAVTTTTATPTTMSNSIMATKITPSPAKTSKRWGLPCLSSAQSTPHASPVDSDWSEEDWGGEIEEKRKEKQRKEE